MFFAAWLALQLATGLKESDDTRDLSSCTLGASSPATASCSSLSHTRRAALLETLTARATGAATKSEIENPTWTVEKFADMPTEQLEDYIRQLEKAKQTGHPSTAAGAVSSPDTAAARAESTETTRVQSAFSDLGGAAGDGARAAPDYLALFRKYQAAGWHEEQQYAKALLAAKKKWAPFVGYEEELGLKGGVYYEWAAVEKFLCCQGDKLYEEELATAHEAYQQKKPALLQAYQDLLGAVFEEDKKVVKRAFQLYKDHSLYNWVSLHWENDDFEKLQEAAGKLQRAQEEWDAGEQAALEPLQEAAAKYLAMETQLLNQKETLREKWWPTLDVETQERFRLVPGLAPASAAAVPNIAAGAADDERRGGGGDRAGGGD